MVDKKQICKILDELPPLPKLGKGHKYMIHMAEAWKPAYLATLEKLKEACDSRVA